MSRIFLKDKDIEGFLEEMFDIPDDSNSEDDLELEGEPELNLETLQNLLEDDSQSQENQNMPDTSSNVSIETFHNSQSDESEAEISILEELEEDSDESEPEKDGNWCKSLWISRPEPEEFDRVKTVPVYLLNSRARPLAHFEKFFNENVYDLIVAQTNLYAEHKKLLHWEPVTKPEIKAFLGILIIMGYIILPHIDLYWSSDPGFRIDEVANVMPIKRFKKILQALHLNDNSLEPKKGTPGHDKLYKLRPLITMLNNSFLENAKNSSSQSIDESMIKFKGRSLKQYMPLKPIKRGYKVWCRNDRQTGYLYEFEIYTGKTAEGVEKGLGADVVKRLTRKLMQEEFIKHVALDNYFSDTSLLQYLHENGLFCTATVRRNRVELPAMIKEKKKLKLQKGQFKWRTNRDVAFLVWQDTKEVLVLSTAFHPKIGTTAVSRTQKDGTTSSVKCPRAIKEYTQRMGGVDRFDRMKASYSVGRRSKRWWLRIFYFLLDAAITNAFMLYSVSISSRARKQVTNLEFRVALARGLIGAHSRKRRRSVPNYVTKKTRVLGSDNYQKATNKVAPEIRFQNVGLHMPVAIDSYRRCKYCSTKEHDKRSKIICEKCTVPLCIVPCFRQYHVNN